jgi:hypothetical protein
MSSRPTHSVRVERRARIQAQRAQDEGLEAGIADASMGQRFPYRVMVDRRRANGLKDLQCLR